MRKTSLLILAMAVLMAGFAYSWTSLTTISCAVAPEGKTDSAKADTFGWHNPGSGIKRVIVYWRFTSTHHNPLCSLILQTRKGLARDSMLTDRVILKAIADSTDSTRSYTIWADSLNIKSWRLIVFSKRDSTYSYIFTKELQ